MVAHETYTGLLLLLATVLAGLAGLFYTFAQSDVTGIPEHDAGNESLRHASGNLVVAYILAYIAAGVSLVLAILYFFQPNIQISEIPHTIVFIIIFALLIISVIFGFVALSDIDESSVSDKKGSVGWIWAGFAMAIFSLLVIIFSGAWRVQHVQNKKVEAASSAPVVTGKTEYSFTSPNVSGQTEYSFQSAGGVPNYPAPSYPVSPISNTR